MKADVVRRIGRALWQIQAAEPAAGTKTKGHGEYRWYLRNGRAARTVPQDERSKRRRELEQFYRHTDKS
jgi:hypothetical protein